MSYGQHGLRSIANATYEPYGSGRDWFFIGDYYYLNGRRTPDPQSRHKAYTTADLPREKLGRAREMQFPRRSPDPGLLKSQPENVRCAAPTACPGSTHIDRWRAFQSGPRRSAEAPTGQEAVDEKHQKAIDAVKKSMRPMRKSGSAPVLHPKAAPVPATITSQDFGRHEDFDRSRSNIDGSLRYRLHSEKVFPKEPGDPEPDFNPTPARWRTTHQDGVQDFPSSKLPDRYKNFSEAAFTSADRAGRWAEELIVGPGRKHLKAENASDPAMASSIYKTTYQAAMGGFDLSQLVKAKKRDSS